MAAWMPGDSVLFPQFGCTVTLARPVFVSPTKNSSGYETQHALPQASHPSMNLVFLLSPAHAAGRRAAMLIRPEAAFELARRVQIGDATLGEIFAFCSGLYFRGKLAYAHRFCRPPGTVAGSLVITPSRGLIPSDTASGAQDLQEFATVPVDASEPRYTAPLVRSATLLAKANCNAVLLGSIATNKYVEPLLPILGERLLFPREFIGRGDMSRGALMLRHATSGEELEYIPVSGAIRRGKRPAPFQRPDPDR
jgi:hypothetical protein